MFSFFLLHLWKINNMALDLSQHIRSLSIRDFAIFSNTKEPVEIPLNQPVFFRGIVLIFCKQGKGRLNIDMREYLIEENTICTIFPGTIFMCTETSDDLLFFSLFFTFGFLAEMPQIKNISFVERIKQYPLQQVSPEDTADLASYFSLIERQSLNQQLNFADKAAKGLVYSLYSEIASIYYLQETIKKETPSSRQNEILNQFFPLLREYSSQRDVSFFADKMCLTPKYLSTKVKKLTGKSVFEWVSTSTIIRAKILLKTTDDPISHISEELNFPNASFFSRFFKKHTNMTPNEYRKKN